MSENIVSSKAPSLVLFLGIISVLGLGFITGIPALLFGWKGLDEVSDPGSQQLIRTGMYLAVLATTSSIILLSFVTFLFGLIAVVL